MFRVFLCYVVGQDETLLTGPLIDKLSSMMEITSLMVLIRCRSRTMHLYSVILFHRKGKERRQLAL